MLQTVAIVTRQLRNFRHKSSSFRNLFQQTQSRRLYSSQQLSRPFSTASTTHSISMDLKDIVKALETIAPTSLAEDWDNVGLLVEPSSPRPINHILLTNDLTEAVMSETMELSKEVGEVGLIISYHPPIFRPFKRLTQSSAKERIIIRALESKIAIYSPHTAHDALWGGVNDWILSGITKDGLISPLSVKEVSDGKGFVLKVGGIRNKEEHKTVSELLKAKVSDDCTTLKEETMEGIETISISCRLHNKTLTNIVPGVTNLLKDFSISIAASEKVPVTRGGRFLTLPQGMSIHSLVSRVKTHLGLGYVRLALGDGRSVEDEVTTLAVCAGSGAAVLKGVPAQVFLTGEMSHHDILEATSRGVSCILCEHSNTERGFLKVFKEILEKKLCSNVRISISQKDKDPIDIV